MSDISRCLYFYMHIHVSFLWFLNPASKEVRKECKQRKEGLGHEHICQFRCPAHLINLLSSIGCITDLQIHTKIRPTQ